MPFQESQVFGIRLRSRVFQIYVKEEMIGEIPYLSPYQIIDFDLKYIRYFCKGLQRGIFIESRFNLDKRAIRYPRLLSEFFLG